MLWGGLLSTNPSACSQSRRWKRGSTGRKGGTILCSTWDRLDRSSKTLAAGNESQSCKDRCQGGNTFVQTSTLMDHHHAPRPCYFSAQPPLLT